MDIKPKHPQQSLIDNITSATPDSSIYQTKPHTETTTTSSNTHTTTQSPINNSTHQSQKQMTNRHLTVASHGQDTKDA